MFTKITKREVILLVLFASLLLMGFKTISGYLLLNLGETIRIACFGDHITLTDVVPASLYGYDFFTANLSCWIVTTQ